LVIEHLFVLIRNGTTDENAMIREERGNLLAADVDALVNTVNAVGVMGKGVALQFKQAFPDNYRAYERACKRGEVRLGRMFVFDTGRLAGPRYIVNFPTKKHWRSRSKLADIELGLEDLRNVIEERSIRSIAVPALGCGNGGLDWRDVYPMINEVLGSLVDVDVVLYPPQPTPTAKTMPVGTTRARMTPGRAALIGLLDRYIGPGLGATPIEIQKLMYFLQAAGEPLRLNFVKAQYGPYADNLNHVLQAIEGHYLRGYGDRSEPVLDAEPIELMPGASEQAAQFLAEHPDTRGRFDRVATLVKGFESPYGLELLASVHWVATVDERGGASDPEVVTRQVQSWTSRKGRLFTERHIVLAWRRLRDEGWLEPGVGRPA
jgi:O-acetyl-ADP-ribose deacetylase (regulator of RNase III)